MAKIPVACSRDDLSRLLDVMDVPSGKACNCVCPSCKAPLIARHCSGDRESNFAHDPAFETEYNYSECALSYYVALKLMLKQIMATADKICLPDYFIKDPYTGNKIEVTKRRTLNFDKIEVDKMGFDALIYFKGVYKLAIIITYPERTFISLPEHEDIHGILEIDLSLLQRSNFAVQKSWTDRLKCALLSQSKSKQWRWHIRADKMLENAKLEFEKKMVAENEPIKQMLSERRNDFAKAQTHTNSLMINVYRCYNCGKDYSENSGLELCPNCNRILHLTSIAQKNFQR
ncbi:hypothetical protein [Shewanella aestuarii]|uniref:Uncharacterized protein n=1 Tax=Shewanella aestuarii TaxID=1028752 RepID=A0A6G9QP37_9GAMM|nr:hypothetical protein [Shewanella aestuarii]QIR16354.1 hypothetical protein HBH39_17870 [Shewanella aestuarii]